MQKIEAAVGEADAQALPPPFGEALVEQRPVEHDLFLRRERRRRQNARAQFGAESVAVPRLPTTTEAAALATRMADSKSACIASSTASIATTVSPAPETSRTFTG